MFKRLFIRPTQELQPVRFFILTGFVFGLLFLGITPPFQGGDEPVHFYRTYQITEGNLIVDKFNGQNGGYLPTSLGQTVVKTTTNPSIATYYQSKYDIHKTNYTFSIPEKESDRQFYDFSSTALYSPISYIPSAIPVFIARVLDTPPIMMLYAGRLGNLIAWLVLVGLAIYFIPRRKWAIAFCGLIPMALFEAATVNIDVMALGTVALFLAYILYLREKKTILSKQQWGILLLMGTIMALSKQALFVFLPLVLLLPHGLFRGKRQSYLVKLGIVAIPVILFVGWMLAIRGVDLSSLYASQNDQNPHEQLEYVIKAPHSFINALWNTHFYTWGDGITRSFIGSFGWLDTPLSESIVVGAYLVMAFLFFANTDIPGRVKQWLTGREKLIILGVMLVYWLAVNTSLYLYYSPIGFKIIYGLQGRYFLPLAFLAVPLLYSSWLYTSKRVYRYVAISAPLVLLTASIITLTVRYFIHNV